MQGLKKMKMLNYQKIILLLKISDTGTFLSINFFRNSFILIPGSVKKQLVSGSRFRGLLDPISDFMPHPYPDSIDMGPKH